MTAMVAGVVTLGFLSAFNTPLNPPPPPQRPARAAAPWAPAAPPLRLPERAGGDAAARQRENLAAAAARQLSLIHI